jgi:acetoin utilization protein AcuB
MLTNELINHAIPQLQLQDSISRALQLIQEYRLTHLPVVSGNRFLGMIAEDDLFDAVQENGNIGVLQDNFIAVAVREEEHFLTTLKCCNLFETNIVPVINQQNELMGVITASDLLKALGDYSGSNEIGGIIVLEMDRYRFAISEISRIVESNDATILHLNTTFNSENSLITVTLQLNKKEIATIVSAFERYEYTIVHYFGDEKFENEIHSNYRHLMSYLDI